MLGPDLSKLNPVRRDFIFGRAVGRVVAHELYHIFGNTWDHGSAGVGEATFSARDLLSDDFRFQAHEVHVLRTRLLPVLLEFNDWLRGDTARPGYSVFLKSGCNGCHGLRGEGTQWGPQLQGVGQAYNAASVSARLKDGKSEMKRKATELNVSWPRLGAREIEELTRFLQSLAEERASRAN
jgi:cytochrome c553